MLIDQTDGRGDRERLTSSGHGLDAPPREVTARHTLQVRESTKAGAAPARAGQMQVAGTEPTRGPM